MEKMLDAGFWAVKTEVILILSSIEYPVSSIYSLHGAGSWMIKKSCLVPACPGWEYSSWENTAVTPKSLAHGFLFFPGEAKSAKQLRLQLIESDSRMVHVLKLAF